MSLEKLHVVFFPAWYPHRGDPMPGLFVHYHARAVQPHARVSVLQVIGEDRKQGPLIEFVFDIEEGIATQRVYYSKLPGPLGKALGLFLYFYGTLKGYSMLTAREGKADLHHVHVLTRAGFLPWLIRISGGVPYLITEHWTRYLPQNRRQFKGGVRKWLTRQVVGKAYAVCPVNETLGQAMQEMGFRNKRFVPVNNVVDLNRFIPPTVPAPPNRFLHVSCFSEPAKNTQGLLRAFSVALKKNPALFLNLVGEGPDFQAARDYAQRLDLDPYVEFHGLQTGEELVRSYQENGSLVLFSNYENQPVVILEAFACGIPAIGSRVGGVAEMLAEGRGILIEAGDEEALCRALLSLSSGEFTASPDQLRDYVQKHNSYESVGRRYFDLYQAALA